MKITHTIIRNGISRGIPEGTMVPEKPTPENFKSKDNWAFTFQSLWDASIEFEDQEAIAYRLPQYTAFERKPDKPKYFGLIDGIYPLEGVNAEKVWQYKTKGYSVWNDCVKAPTHFNDRFDYRSFLRLIPQPNSDNGNNHTSPLEKDRTMGLPDHITLDKDRVEGTEVSEPTARQITYAFLELPYHRKVEIAISLNVYDKADYHLPETEKWKLVFGRIKEAGRTKELWDKVKPEVVGVDEKKEPSNCQYNGLCEVKGDPKWCTCAREDKGVSDGEPKITIGLLSDWDEAVELYHRSGVAEVMKQFHIQKLKP